MSDAPPRPSEAEKRAAKKKANRDAVFGHYGWKCQCCGVTESSFLTIDHKNEDGSGVPNGFRKSRDAWIIRAGFPDYLWTLCWNCNRGKHFNGGSKCPHQGVVEIQRRRRPAQCWKWQQKRKRKIMDHYGKDGGCVCCGEKNLFFLELDHIDGGGTKHIKETNFHLYTWVTRNNYPPGFQTMCSNCNHAKHANEGVCPHQNLVAK